MCRYSYKVCNERWLILDVAELVERYESYGGTRENSYIVISAMTRDALKAKATNGLTIPIAISRLMGKPDSPDTFMGYKIKIDNSLKPYKVMIKEEV